MARVPLIVGNWKMNCTRGEAADLVAALTPLVLDARDRQIIVAPPFTALETVSRVTTGTPIGLAAQNLHWEPEGSFTGEVSAAMLAELGCAAVIIGHSERRQYFGETNEGGSRKIGAALAAGMFPIVCIGESLQQRESGGTHAVIEAQLRGAWSGLGKKAISSCVVAYEPLWAIGTGKTATPAQAEEVHALIRKLAGDLASREVAAGLRILYGGSVNPQTVDGLMAQEDVDGTLVGGASLKAADFARIVNFQS